MKLYSVVLVFLTRALLGEVSEALNVTVTPGPVGMCTEGENVTLTCLVSQKKRASSVLVLRWMFSHGVGGEEHLLVKLNMRRTLFFGNYSRRFGRPKFQLTEEELEKVYRLEIANVSRLDRGNYTCRVQEIRRHRNRWRASANGTGSVELRVHHLPETGADGIWHLFEDVYVCAVLICSAGLLSMLVFSITLACQSLQRRHTLSANYNLVKCPENSSGETVTSELSSSPGMHRKERRHKSRPERGPDLPPQIPAKAPVTDKLRRPKLLKPQLRKAPPPRIAEDSLTYAELELVKPKPEPKASCSGTVYAQIVFVEKQV